MTQHLNIVQRLRSALDHPVSKREATTTTTSAAETAAGRSGLPQQQRGEDFAERLRAAIPDKR